MTSRGMRDIHMVIWEICRGSPCEGYVYLHVTFVCLARALQEMEATMSVVCVMCIIDCSVCLYCVTCIIYSVV